MFVLNLYNSNALNIRVNIINRSNPNFKGKNYICMARTNYGYRITRLNKNNSKNHLIDKYSIYRHWYISRRNN
jgi:hypothetical protein